MGRRRVVWSTVLVVLLLLLIGYGFWGYNFVKNNDFRSYGQGNNYGGGMMNSWVSPYNNQQNYSNKQKMLIDQIKNADAYVKNNERKCRL